MSMFVRRNKGRALGKRRLTAIAALIAAVALVAVPQAALAQQVGPTNDQYDPSSDRISQAVAGGGEDPGDPSADRVVAALPFTGLDLGLIAVVAIMLGGSGLALRRLAGAASER